MAAAVQALQNEAGSGTPYVGLRPFERGERDRFFGRERDGRILCDRTLSGRLTVLYAQSGLGKSSLLRAMVVPELEQNGCHVLYFDSWSQEDPWRALRDELIGLASRAGVHDAGAGSPTLAELVRLIGNVSRETTVLILDQFEEFLLHHGQALDPLRSELAALVQSPTVDAAVVLALREEFLAALEPFRQRIPNLFQGAYRLEPISEVDLALAIYRPAEQFGGSCEAELAEQLIRDLRSGQSDPSSAGTALVELPMLQLICLELWSHAAGHRLTVDLYRGMGGAQRILDGYVRELMPAGSKQQTLTARLLVHLAPPSGLKMSYSVDDLCATTGLDRTAIETELERLSRARILRPRQHRGGQRFELQHDAFIPVLSSWRDRILERGRKLKVRRRILAAGAIVAAVIVGMAGFFVWQTRVLQRAAALRAALSAGDPLVSILAIREIGESAATEQAFGDIRQLVTSAIPTAVLRDSPGSSPAPLAAAWFMPETTRILTISTDTTLKWWGADGRGHPEARPFSMGAKVAASALSADGQWLAAGLDNGAVFVGHSTGQDLVSAIATSGPKITALAVAGNRERVAVGYDDNTFEIWRYKDGTFVRPREPVKGHTGQITSLQFDTSGRFLLTASYDGEAKTWSVGERTTPLATLTANRAGMDIPAAAADNQISAAAFSQDGKWVICGLQSGRAAVYPTEGQVAPLELKGHDDAVRSARFSPDGSLVVTGSQDQTARVWRIRADAAGSRPSEPRLLAIGAPVVLKGHAGPVVAVAFSPDGGQIVTASDDGTARVWSSTPGEPRLLGKHDGPVERIAFSPDGRRFASASRDKTVQVWEFDRSEHGATRLMSLPGHGDWVRTVAFSPDGKTLLTASEDDTLRLWDLQSGNNSARRTIPGLMSAAWAPGGNLVVTASRPPKAESGDDSTVRIWSADTAWKQPVLRVGGQREWAFSAAFGPDSTRIVSASVDGSAKIWRLHYGNGAVEPAGQMAHADRVFNAVFSADGGMIATSSADRTARLWTADGKELARFNHAGEVWQVSFSSGSRWLASASLDGAVKIWDLRNRNLWLTLSHPAGVRAAAFRPGTSPDVVTGDDSGGVYLWRTSLHAMLDYMNIATAACLKPAERERILGESPARALGRYAECEARYGRGSTN